MADKNSITSFLNGFFGGTRLNRFAVETSGCGTIVNQDTKFHIRAATTPASNITPIGINYFGRTIPIPGERTYDPWIITVLDDRGDRELYNKFKLWQKSIMTYGTDVTVGQIPKSCIWTLKHYANENTTNGKTFKLYQAWPIEIGPFNLDMSQDNVLATFQVTIAYTHFDFEHK